MTHFIAYHNPDPPPDGMGYAATEIDTSCGFQVLTRKPLGQIVGSRVWLVTGEGRPRRYSLVYTFVADEISPSEHPDFRFEVSGRSGRRFRRPVPLDSALWLRPLLRVTGNFGLGLQPISDAEVVAGLESVATLDDVRPAV